MNVCKIVMKFAYVKYHIQGPILCSFSFFCIWSMAPPEQLHTISLAESFCRCVVHWIVLINLCCCRGPIYIKRVLRLQKKYHRPCRELVLISQQHLQISTLWDWCFMQHCLKILFLFFFQWLLGSGDHVLGCQNVWKVVG